MKILNQKITLSKSFEHIIPRKITNVVHNVPTWVFPRTFDPTKKKHICPLCYSEIRLQTGHGEWIEHCSIIQIDGHETMPIHTDCYNKLEDHGN